MTKEMTCISCPMGCRLSVQTLADGQLVIQGNKCPRGAKYATEELLSPKRVVTATCRPGPSASGVAEGGTAGGAIRVPCRTVQAFPRERVDELLALLYSIKVPLPVSMGDVIVKDALGSGIDVIATRSIR